MNPSPIVCATDLSEVSRAAVRLARALAQREGGDLHVLQVGPGPHAAGRTGRAVADRDGSVPPGRHDPEWQTTAERSGDPVDAVVDYAREVGARLIVVGTALPRAGMSQRESIGETIARRAVCPTLVVPTGLQATAEDLPFRTIVCAVDLSPGSLTASEEAIRLATSGGGALTFVHVLDEFDDAPTLAHYVVPEYRRQRLLDTHRRLVESIPREAMNWAHIDVKVMTGDAGERILSLARRLRADVIVMGVTPRTRLSRLLLGSTSHRVTDESACPVLVVRAQAAAPTWVSDHQAPQVRAEREAPMAFPPDYVAAPAGRDAASAAGPAGSR